MPTNELAKAAKKATKKVAKKAAKKTAKKAAHHPSHDLRRAYEHLGRIETLQSALPAAPAREVSTLAALAQKELAVSHGQHAADLLRAAEHLSFAALAPDSASRVSPDLKAAIAAEFDRLLRRAEDHAAEPLNSSIAGLYRSTLHQAREALAAGSYREALELARAAEALTHIKHKGPAKLSAPAKLTHRLAS